MDLNSLLEECLGRYPDQGMAVFEEACKKYPKHADAIRRKVSFFEETGLLQEKKVAKPATPTRLGEFRILSQLGSGAMGVVYLAEREGDGQEVALKLLHPERMYYPKSLQRFQREVEAVSRLHHPGIVPVLDTGKEGGIPYFAMERIQGCTLETVLEEFKSQRAEDLVGEDLYSVIFACTAREGEEIDQEQIPEPFRGSWEKACLHITRQIAQALEHAHSRGIVHRDVKPSNIMVTRTGRAMLFDFGLAMLEGSAKLTMSGTQIGSLAYMASEQIEGKAEGVLGERADIYSLGVSLYQMLTLKLPYLGQDNEQTRHLIEMGQAIVPTKLNENLSWQAENVCLKAMDRESGRRYVMAGELSMDLGNALDGRAVMASRPGVLLQAQGWLRTNRTVAAVLGVVLVSLAGFYVQERQARLTAEELQTEAEEMREHAKASEEKARRLAEEADRARVQVVKVLNDNKAIKEFLKGDPGAAELFNMETSVYLEKRAKMYLAGTGLGKFGKPYLPSWLFKDLQDFGMDDLAYQVRLHWIDARQVFAEERHNITSMISTRVDRAKIYIQQNRIDEAEVTLEDARKILPEVPIPAMSPDHPYMVQNMVFLPLATVYYRQGRGEEAAELLETIIDFLESRRMWHHPFYKKAKLLYADSSAWLGR